MVVNMVVSNKVPSEMVDSVSGSTYAHRPTLTRQNLPRHIPTYAITLTFSQKHANARTLFPAALLSSIVTMVSIESYAAFVVSGEANTPPRAPLLTTISRLPILS